MNIVASLEALLFVANAPVPTEELARALGATAGQVEQALEILQKRLGKESSLDVVKLAGGYQLSTRTEYASVIGGFLSPQRARLSRSLMEVLAIVAYRQPITAAEIDAVRGVQSDYGIRSLLERRLIRDVGRKKAPGRPTLYATTQQFQHQFNLKSLDDLPPLEEGLPAKLDATLQALPGAVIEGSEPDGVDDTPDDGHASLADVLSDTQETLEAAPLENGAGIPSAQHPSH